MIEAELDKRYGVREVLSRATIRVREKTVHALVGENGAGKSTLVKIVAGIVHADAGTLSVDGRSIELAGWTRIAARQAGIGIVQQHGAFAPTLSVVENAVLGAEAGAWLALDEPASKLKQLGEQVGLPIDPWARAGSLALGEAQRAEVVAALYHGAKLLILDEPTAVLTPVEVDGLLRTLRQLATSGTTIVIVTHKLDEVETVADDITVLRDGKTVATFERDTNASRGFDARAIVRAMVGRDLPKPTKLAAPEKAAVAALELIDVSIAPLSHVSLRVRAGEVVGVAGIDGNGQRELAQAIAGLAPIASGRVILRGGDVTRLSARARLRAGLAHIPEDRLHGGLVVTHSVEDNLALGRADITGRWRIDREAVTRNARTRIVELDIRPPDPRAPSRSLSGGNQQKVVVGRELSRPELVAVVAAQPTRGVDLGAVVRIHDRLRQAALGGAGVLVISADLDELLALCHRVVVLLRGRIVGEREAAKQGARDEIGALMTGVTGAQGAA